MGDELSNELTNRVQSLWLRWQSGRPSHQALFFDFHAEVIENHHELSHVTLFQTLGALLRLQESGERPPSSPF